MKRGCQFVHPHEICEDWCHRSGCLKRHPKICKYGYPLTETKVYMKENNEKHGTEKEKIKETRARRTTGAKGNYFL